MIFSKENVENYWNILNKSGVAEERKAADEFLIEFKKSPDVLEICLQLFESLNPNTHFFAAVVIYQRIKERANDLLDKKEEFLRYRSLIFDNLLEKLKNSAHNVIERICYSISILMATGAISYWTECVEDLIQFAQISKQNCYFSLIILENINKELYELNISTKTLLRIKDIMIFKSPVIQEFIFLVLTHVSPDKSNNEDLAANNQLFNLTLLLTHSWIKFGLNVLKIPALSQTLINYLNAENIKYISDIFCENISVSLNSKYYSVNEEYNLEEIFHKYDEGEFKSLQNLIEMIKTGLINLQKLTDEEEAFTILNGLANIFQSIIDSYINLLFTKDELSKVILELFFFFAAHKNRKISFKFMECINELREFINRGYKLYNYTNEEKIEFLDYLIKINENVMINCKLKSLNFNTGLIKKETLESDDLEVLQNNSQPRDIEDYENNVSINDYRKGAEDVFYNIFLIFTHNFREEGAEYYFKWIMGVLDQLGINEESVCFNEDRLLLIDVVLIAVKSILDTFDITGISDKYIIDFCTTMINSKILNNSNMVVIYLMFLDQACPFIGRDVYLLNTTIQFLTSTLKVKILEGVSSYIILQITDFLKFPSIECFELLYSHYKENYDNFSHKSLDHLGESLCGLVSVLDKEQKTLINTTEDQVINYLILVLQPATERIHKTYELILSYNENLDINRIKIEFIRNYNIFQNTLKRSYFLSKNILKEIFSIYIKELSQITSYLFNYFVKDAYVIKELSKVYAKLIVHLGEDVVGYFDYINDLMLNAYYSNMENFSCLTIIKILYHETIKYSAEKKEYISNNFINLCDAIYKNIYQMKRQQVDVIDIYSQLLIRVIDSLEYLVVNEEVLHNTNKLFIEAINTVQDSTMNKNILKFFNRYVSSQKFPRGIVEKDFPGIVYNAYKSSDNLESVGIQELTLLTLNSIAFDSNTFFSTLLSVFNEPKFQSLKQDNIAVIVDFMKILAKSDKILKPLIFDITNFAKGMGQSEVFMQYAMALVQHQRKNNVQTI